MPRARWATTTASAPPTGSTAASSAAVTDWTWGRLNVEIVSKLALGVTQQSTNIEGQTVLFTPDAPTQTAPGGILAQPTNIGNHFHQTFSMAPEGQLNLGYQITPWLQARVGYSVLYWTNVLRPGNTIDRTVNYNQVPSDPAFGMMPGGRQPAAVHSDPDRLLGRRASTSDCSSRSDRRCVTG